MSICIKCGTKIPEDASYCPTCGTPLNKRLLASVTKLDRIIDTLTKLTVIFLFSGAIPLLILVGQERELALDIWLIILGLLFLVVISCGILRLWYRSGKKMRLIPRDISDRTEFRYILTDRILALFGFVAIFSTFGAVLAFHLFNNETAAMYLMYVLLSTAIIALVFTIVMFVYFLFTKKGRALMKKDLKNVSQLGCSLGNRAWDCSIEV